MVGLTGLPPGEGGGVQMGSSVMEDKLNDIDNGANTLCECTYLCQTLQSLPGRNSHPLSC